LYISSDPLPVPSSRLANGIASRTAGLVGLGPGSSRQNGKVPFAVRVRGYWRDHAPVKTSLQKVTAQRAAGGHHERNVFSVLWRTSAWLPPRSIPGNRDLGEIRLSAFCSMTAASEEARPRALVGQIEMTRAIPVRAVSTVEGDSVGTQSCDTACRPEFASAGGLEPSGTFPPVFVG
jgi:hypothetical protein